MSIESKVTIITGAAQGIGFACGQRFAQEGARVVLADINTEKGEAAAESIRSAGGEAIFVGCDVGDKAQVVSLIEKAIERYGRLDVMISNAAVLHIAGILDLEEEDYDRVVRVNLKGFFLTGQAAARQMVAQGGGGSIINMSSIQAVITLPNILTYSICKGGVKSLTVSMALALADKGIRVNAIGPGSIATDMVKQLMVDDAARDKLLSRTPLGRLGDPSEVASVAVFLASDESSYVTGETIYVDGGRLGLNYTVPVAG
ncbi:MAG: SDR family oxidoreductase [Gammaproteobacteria bacterium]|jgi:NAD(P)-dependent dehydrogenase (short-subunit alcohol dehydrogenase family)